MRVKSDICDCLVVPVVKVLAWLMHAVTCVIELYILFEFILALVSSLLLINHTHRYINM